MPRCLIALGANLGDRAATLVRAVAGLRNETAVARHSAWHETPPVGGPPGQGAFLNGAVLLDTSLPPEGVLAMLRRIEGELGRTRHEPWAARTIDLDLLLYGDMVIHTPELIVPHPRMAFRRFVLEPAADVAPEMLHPGIGWTVAKLLDHLNTAPPYLALLGMPGSGKTRLAERLEAAGLTRFSADPLTPTRARLADPPSHDLAVQIQFLDRAAGLTSRALLPDGRSWVVTDYTFDQCLAYAEVGLDAEDFSTFRQAWSARRSEIVAPKLLLAIGLDAAAESDLADVRSDSASIEPAWVEPDSSKLRAALRRLAARSGCGPVLHVPANDEDAQWREVSAALTAMQ